MSRRLVAILISAVAIFFAFGALTAIRWPSIVMFLGVFFHPDPSMGFDSINWRELGFAYGAPYFLASLCFYASSICLAQRTRGALIWYVMACFAASPSIFMVDLQAGWWLDPSGPEGIFFGGALIIAMLGYAVFLLCQQSKAPALTGEDETQGVHLSPEQFDALLARSARAPEREPQQKTPPKRRRGPVPAAIARQREQFAAEGRRMMARRAR